MVQNVTDSTCEWGLAQTEDGCVRTLASYNTFDYSVAQILYCSLGFVAMMVASFKYIRSVNRDAANLQQRTFLLSVYASGTVMLRGIDPFSYKHVLPRPITSFLSDSCTAALYSIFMLSLTYWITLVQQGSTPETKPTRMKYVEGIVIVTIWLFYIACNATFFMDKGFGGVPPSVLMLGTAGFLSLLSITFWVYGFRVLRRLEYFDRLHRQRAMQTSTNYTEQPALLEDELEKPKRAPHTAKIQRVIIITLVVSVIALLGQIYMGATLSHDRLELDCANGFNCEDVKATIPALHIFQYATIWVILFMFRKIRRSRPAQNDTRTTDEDV